MSNNKKEITINITEEILEIYKVGNVAFLTIDGLCVCTMQEMINQSADGLLYDLNKCESVILSSQERPGWINDLATCKVIQALKARITELENKIENELPKN